MSRLASGLIAGMALGAAGAYFCLMGGAERGFAPDAAVGLKSSAAPSAVNRPSATALPTVGGFSERSAVYQLAADADPASLRSRIEEGAARPESAERRFLLATLLSRYAEFYPREAIALAEDLELDSAFVAPLYGSWAGSDAAAALDAWTHSIGTGEGYAIGLAMFEALGGDEQAFSILLTSVPPDLNAEHFQMELVELWAQTAPEVALQKNADSGEAFDSKQCARECSGSLVGTGSLGCAERDGWDRRLGPSGNFPNLGVAPLVHVGTGDCARAFHRFGGQAPTQLERRLSRVERDRSIGSAARALVDEYVSDSNTRQQIERFLR